MPIFKGTIIFAGPAHGWTESYLLNNAEEDYTGSMTKLRSLGTLRARLLGESCRLIGLRISQEGVRYDALSQAVNYPSGRGPYLPGWPSDAPDAALLIRCEDILRRRHKNIFLRGIPDDLDQQFGQYTPLLVPGWSEAFSAWQLQLTSDQWGWSGGVAAGANRSPIQSITSPGGGRVLITTFGPLVPAGLVGSGISVRGSGINKPGVSVLNSQMVVTVITQNSFLTNQPYAFFVGSSGGFLSWSAKEFVGIRDTKPLRIVTRRVGAPLLASRGRRKTRAKG